MEYHGQDRLPGSLDINERTNKLNEGFSHPAMVPGQMRNVESFLNDHVNWTESCRPLFLEPATFFTEIWISI